MAFYCSLADNPSARKKIELTDNIDDILAKMAEGDSNALSVLNELYQFDIFSIKNIFTLDDMNIRGNQIWVAYNYFNKDINIFIEAIAKRDKNMVDFLNQEMLEIDSEKAVRYGASYDRHCFPFRYRFDENDIKKIKSIK